MAQLADGPCKDGDSEKYYQTQLDAYSFLLNSNGYKTGDLAYLVYYYPDEVTKNGVVRFSVTPVKVETNLKRAEKTFRDAVGLLKGSMPKNHTGCEYCSWVIDRVKFESGQGETS